MENPNENIQPNLNREQTNGQSPGVGNLGSQDVFHEKLHCRDLENESVNKSTWADLKKTFDQSTACLTLKCPFFNGSEG